jgi:hypothetical protein
MSVADKLTSILNSKQAIKDALIEKGVSDVSDVLSEYPEYILNIPSGGDEPDIPEPDIPEPDEPIEEWVYPEDWPDLEQVLEENQIEGYPYRIIQLLGKGTTTTSLIKVRPVINDDKGINFVTWNTIVKCSDGTSYDLSSPTDDFIHTWTSLKTEYRWIIYYFKEKEISQIPPMAKDCLCIIIDGLSIRNVYGGSTDTFQTVDMLFSNRYYLQYIKGINDAIIKESNTGCFVNCYSLAKIDIPIDLVYSADSMFQDCRSLLEIPQINSISNKVTTFSNMFQGCSSLRSIPDTIKTDNGINFSNMFQGCSSLRSIPDTIKTDNGTSFSYMFQGCSSLRSIPDTIKTDNGTSFSYMFDDCSNLRSIPDSIKTDNCTSFISMFQGCSNLRSIPDTIKTDNGTSFNLMFQGCSNLISIPDTIKTDKGTVFDSMFQGCSSLRSIPDTIKTDKGTSFSNMFYCCSNLISIPDTIKTDKGTVFGSMFRECNNLVTIPDSINTEKGTNLSYMFYRCSNLRSIPDTVKTDESTNVSYMFQDCSSLTEIPSFNTHKSTSLGSMFSGCVSLKEIKYLDTTSSTSYGASSIFSSTKLQSIKNFKLGKNISSGLFTTFESTFLTDISIDISGCTGSNINTGFVNYCPKITNFESLGTIDGAINFSNCTLLTYESLMNVLNSLSPVTSTKTLKLGAENLAKLTEEEIAIGTDKGWSITA